MSNTRQDPFSQEAADAGQRQQNAPPTLRVLAPKPPHASASQSLAIRVATPPVSGTSGSKRRSPTTCPVCYRIGCQLPTHSAFSNQSASSSTTSVDKSTSAKSRINPSFTASYAYRLAQQYVDPDIAASKIDPFYDLPLGEGMNTVEVHRLFHRWFTVDTKNMIKITPPIENGGGILLSPFFLPAMQDSLLCLSILAVAASRVSPSPQTSNITSWTLLSQAAQQMRERVHSNPDHISDTTISAANFLWAIDIFNGNTDGMVSHSRAMSAFVATRGGLHKLGLVGAIAQVIRLADAVTSFYLPIPCHYHDVPEPEPVSDLPQARYGRYWEDQNAIAKMNIHKDVIISCRETCRVMEHWENAEREGVSGAEYIRLIQWYTILYQRGSIVRAKHHGQGDVSECIGVAVLLLQYHCFIGFEELMSMASINVNRLITAIRACGPPMFWQKDPDLLIWLLIVVLLVPINNEERSGCLRFLCRAVTARFSREGTLKREWRKDLRKCVHSFVWCDLRLQDDLQSICEEIETELKHNVGKVEEKVDDDDDDDDGDDNEDDDE